MSAEAKFLFVRVAGIVLGVPVVFVIVTFGVDSIFFRHDPAGDLWAMRYVMVGLVVLLAAGQYWLEARHIRDAARDDGRGLGRESDEEG